MTEPYNKACGQSKIVTMCPTPTTAQCGVATETHNPRTPEPCNPVKRNLSSCAIPQCTPRETFRAVHSRKEKLTKLCNSARTRTSRAAQFTKKDIQSWAIPKRTHNCTCRSAHTFACSQGTFCSGCTLAKPTTLHTVQQHDGQPSLKERQREALTSLGSTDCSAP